MVVFAAWGLFSCVNNLRARLSSVGHRFERGRHQNHHSSFMEQNNSTVRRAERLLMLAFSIVNLCTASSEITVQPNGATGGMEPMLHPDYPQLPLSLAAEYKHGVPINLSYPGLQLGVPQCVSFLFPQSTDSTSLATKILHSAREPFWCAILHRE